MTAKVSKVNLKSVTVGLPTKPITPVLSGTTRVERAQEVKDRTLTIVLDVAGKPYDREDVGRAIAEHVDPLSIVFLGPLNRNVEWYVTFVTCRPETIC